jgi:sulfide:quinone oxidoreductase
VTRVLILGAGFGGLELATRLSEELGEDAGVTLIDQGDAFVFGYTKLDVLFGRATPESVRLPYAALSKPGVTFLQETVRAIDPGARRVVTDRGTHEADVLVVALGADLDPEATPGLVEEGTEFYSVPGAERTARRLAEFGGGAVVIAILGPFFKCPAAPFECALMLHDFLEAKGLRGSSTITVASPMGAPIPISPEASAYILDTMAARDITWMPQSVVNALDPPAGTATLTDGRTLPYDFFLAVPVHKAPDVVVESGLTVDGWVPVDPSTLATPVPGVWAVGDCTNAPVPRVGVMAEGEARTAAEGILAALRGGPGPDPFAGQVSCYIELGADTVARFEADFLTGPAPHGTFTPPSAELAESKRRFGADRRARWFGLD